MAEENDPFGTFVAGPSSPASDSPSYRPRRRTGRKWLFAVIWLLLVCIFSLPILDYFDVIALPRHEGLMETVQTKNRAGGRVEVFYNHRVKKREAERVGEILVEADAIGGADGASVFVERRDGVTIAFFIEFPMDHGRDSTGLLAERQRMLDQMQAQLRPIGDRLSVDLFQGSPVAIELCQRQIHFGFERTKRTVIRRF